MDARAGRGTGGGTTAVLLDECRERLRPLVRRIRALGSAAYSHANEESVIARLLSTVDADQFCVDIGASDGQTMSNMLALYERGWRGLSVEMDGDSFKALAGLHARFPGSSLFRGKVTPDNVLDIMRGAGVPSAPGFLSLDIDGYDYFVLDQILSEYRPVLVCTEINEKVPPPLRFTVNYDPDYHWGVNHFYGQSISQLQILCDRYGYGIVELEYNNAFLMPGEVAGATLSAEEAYRTGYIERPDRHTRFPWNADMEVLHELGPAAAVDHLNRVFASYRGRYTLDAGPP